MKNVRLLLWWLKSRVEALRKVIRDRWSMEITGTPPLRIYLRVDGEWIEYGRKK